MICVDYSNLNQACPRDNFPLPRIDQLVDSTARHKVLKFIISKVTNKHLHFLKILKRQKKFQWMEEYNVALQEFKKHFG